MIRRITAAAACALAAAGSFGYMAATAVPAEAAASIDFCFRTAGPKSMAWGNKVVDMQWTITGNANDWQSFGTISTDDNGCANVDVPYFQEAFRVRGVTAYEEKNQDGTITRHWVGVTSVASPGVHHESLGLFDVYCHPMNNFKCPPGTQIPVEKVDRQ